MQCHITQLYNLKDVEGKSKTAMKMTKGRIADSIGDPD
ncbi:hypothetical protein MTR67_003027 [Solanum verrucosum]|uniref:Uncharacterized protein n=1 Tax=Solanum verrucosum TaxID=315347 RepID=A0AAF0PRR1_SOLVR|nr:hypothetical protein MTR67_003027 [Solanum verrucosum]